MAVTCKTRTTLVDSFVFGLKFSRCNMYFISIKSIRGLLGYLLANIESLVGVSSNVDIIVVTSIITLHGILGALF